MVIIPNAPIWLANWSDVGILELILLGYKYIVRLFNQTFLVDSRNDTFSKPGRVQYIVRLSNPTFLVDCRNDTFSKSG